MTLQILSSLDEKHVIPNSQPVIHLADGGTIIGPENACEGGMALPGGVSVWLASQPNTRPHEGYRGKNSDAAVVITRPAISVPPAKTLSKALLKAGGVVKKTVELQQGGGTTGIGGWCDLKAYTLDVSSIGDSLAFLLFHDGTKGVSVQINDRYDELIARSGQGTASLDYHTRPPAIGSCAISESKNVCFWGKLDIEKIKRAVCKYHGLDASRTQVTLVLASDGINALAKVDKTETNSTVFRGDMPDLVHHALLESAHNGKNPATTIARVAAERYAAKKGRNDPKKHYHDDTTVVVMPLIQDACGPDGDPVVFFLADGIGREGKQSSNAAVVDFTETIQSLDQTLDTPEAGSSTWANPGLKKDTTTGPPGLRNRSDDTPRRW